MIVWLLQATIAASASCLKAEYAAYGNITQYTQPPLPYGYSCLQPFMWEPELYYHYIRIHSQYVYLLNNLTAWTPAYQGYTVEQLLMSKASSDSNLATYAGGHYSHSLWWWILTPYGSGTSAPSGSLGDKINAQWGNFSNFQTEFEKNGRGLFGSGWVWLCLDTSSVFQIKAKKQEYSPLQDSCLPLLGLDVWEHSYYLTYLYNRANYTTSLWSYIDWELLEYFYEEYLESGQPVPI